MLFVVAVACSGKAPAPTAAPRVVIADAALPDAVALDRDLPALVERSLAMYQQIAAALAASGEDCTAAVTKLDQLAAVYRDVVAANAKVVRDGRAQELRAALEPHGEELDGAAQQIMQSPTMAKCAQAPEFAHAFDALLEPR